MAQSFDSFAHSGRITRCDLFVHSLTSAAQTPGETSYLQGDTLGPLLSALNGTTVRLSGRYRSIDWGDSPRLYDLYFYHDGGQGTWVEDASFTLDENGNLYGRNGLRYRMEGEFPAALAAIRAAAGLA